MEWRGVDQSRVDVFAPYQQLSRYLQLVPRHKEPLYYTILYSTLLYYTILYHTILHYTTLHYTTPHLVVTLPSFWPEGFGSAS